MERHITLGLGLLAGAILLPAGVRAQEPPDSTARRISAVPL